MEKYNEFKSINRQIQAKLDEMKLADERQMVEQLELETRNLFKSMIMVMPHIENEIHTYALSEIQRITAEETETNLKR